MYPTHGFKRYVMPTAVGLTHSGVLHCVAPLSIASPNSPRFLDSASSASVDSVPMAPTHTSTRSRQVWRYHPYHCWPPPWSDWIWSVAASHLAPLLLSSIWLGWRWEEMSIISSRTPSRSIRSSAPSNPVPVMSSCPPGALLDKQLSAHKHQPRPGRQAEPTEGFES